MTFVTKVFVHYNFITEFLNKQTLGVSPSKILPTLTLSSFPFEGPLSLLPPLLTINIVCLHELDPGKITVNIGSVFTSTHPGKGNGKYWVGPT